MKATVVVVLVGLCLLLAVGASVWFFRRKKPGGEEAEETKEVEVDADFWRDFPIARESPLPIPYGPYFPLDAKGIDKVVAFDDVLSESEMVYLRSLLKEGVKKGRLAKGANPWIKALEERIAKLLQKSPQLLEPLRLIRQDPGDESSPHIDALEDGGGKQGQRLSTLHIFLNSLPPLEEGGRTIFNKLDAGLKPKAGTAIGWNNVVVAGGAANQIDHEMWHMSQALTLDNDAKYTLVAYSRERGC